MTDDDRQGPGDEPDEQARVRQERLRALRQKLRTEPPLVGQNAGGPAAETGETGGGSPRLAELLRARRANQGEQTGGQAASGGGELLKRLAGLRQNAPAGAGRAGGGGELLKRLATLRQKQGAGAGGAAGGGNRGALLQALREGRSAATPAGAAPGGGQAGERFPRLRERLRARGGPQASDDTPESARLEQDVRRLEEKVRELEAELRESRANADPGQKSVQD